MAARHQQGQAMVVTTVMLAGMVLAWLLVFNVGQTVNAKLRLNAAADAAAYSAALWQARSLNYQAYLNRGIVANEVAIAQLVSLRSWSGYVDRLLSNVALVSNIIPPLGRAIHGLSRAWSGVNSSAQAVMPPLESGLSRWNVDVLLKAQALAQQQAPIAAADLAEQVTLANLPEARVSRLTAAFQVRNGAAFSNFSQTRRHGSGELRPYVRLLESSRDGFSAERRFDLIPANPVAKAPKRGGTDLIGEYAWRGADTLATHVDLLLTDVELPVGWGAAESRHHVQRQQGVHGGSRSSNPRTTRLALASSSIRDGYRGVPEFRDLRGTPDAEEARLRYVVALELPRTAVRLADAVLGIDGVEDHAGNLHTAGAPGQTSMQSLGAAEVYFQRPVPRDDGNVELPSLFNPYWQARLAARPAGGVRALLEATR
jgi:hypothetical protein